MKKPTVIQGVLIAFIVIDIFVLGFCTSQVLHHWNTPKEQAPRAMLTLKNGDVKKAMDEVPEDSEVPTLPALTKEEAIALVERSYPQDGHIAVMSEDAGQYYLGRFMERQTDPATGKPAYNQQAAAYTVDKYTGELTLTEETTVQAAASPTQTSVAPTPTAAPAASAQPKPQEEPASTPSVPEGAPPEAFIEAYIQPKPDSTDQGTSYAYVHWGTEKVNGQDMDIVNYGVDSPDTFSTLRHFAVSPDRKTIYEMDLSTGEYVPAWP